LNIPCKNEWHLTVILHDAKEDLSANQQNDMASTLISQQNHPSKQNETVITAL